MNKSTLNLDALLTTTADRQLTTPLLLFLTGHRPLAFFVGQALYAVAPLAALLGRHEAGAWAELLSAPNAIRGIEARLTAHDRPGMEPHVLE